ncbi:MAG: transcriptional regulator [Microbacterium sp.]|jgi:DNA-binding MarR family transcriptional regulator|uniref:MarR family winged helix-turn-helix transcriptional regulator n=1 Tax=unclassified Microbacterium TaxID=2609290 RepID=UPI000DB5808E|nr:MarR family winged helix-turn-helix transcriptional regulator [Microbacterium sp.]PZU40693.1 MAG: transcriptional regulator [Microbacterium sp.]
MAERITVTLHELVSALDTYADAVLQSRYGVTYNQFEFLVAVHEQAPTDITGLAHCLRVSKAAVSKRVPGLVAEGWITTGTDPSHARRVMLALTPRAERLVHDAGGALDAEFTALFADPRLDPRRTAGAVDVPTLNTHLAVLTDLVLEKGTPS